MTVQVLLMCTVKEMAQMGHKSRRIATSHFLRNAHLLVMNDPLYCFLGLSFIACFMLLICAQGHYCRIFALLLLLQSEAVGTWLLEIENRCWHLLPAVEAAASYSAILLPFSCPQKAISEAVLEVDLLVNVGVLNCLIYVTLFFSKPHFSDI